MRRAVALVAIGMASFGARAESLPGAPNVVPISPSLVTAGQPSAQALAALKAQGFEAVIYLAPPTVGDAVREEHLIVARQGLAFINIPIRFEQPTEADFQTFAAVLKALGDRKVLVHCQVNFRASSMVFLYRVIHGRADPRAAYESVTRVWAPSRPWRELIEGQLRKHRIDFEIL